MRRYLHCKALGVCWIDRSIRVGVDAAHDDVSVMMGEHKRQKQAPLTSVGRHAHPKNLNEHISKSRQTLDGGAFLSGSVCLMRLLD
jgi:hypothetical protein